MKVAIQRTDGETIELDAVKHPWTWRTFLVVDKGEHNKLTYVPLDLVDTFEVTE